MVKFDKESNPSRSYERRAKIAALLSSMPVLLIGIELASATQASAQPEATAQLEAQSPQAFMNYVDSHMTKLEAEIKQAHGLQKEPDNSNSTVSQAAKLVFPGCHIYYIGMPSHSEQGKYDVFTMIIEDKTNKPVLTSLNKGLATKKWTPQLSRPSDGGGYIVAQSKIDPGAPLHYTPGNTIISVTSPGEGNTQDYQVRTSGTAEGGAIQYTTSPTKVAAQFNRFLNDAQTIINHNK